jgi:hypothetical protein
MADTRAAKSGDQYAIRLTRHTGMIFLGQSRTAVTRGTYEECMAAYKSAQTHNFTLGWWGIISLFLTNPMAIFGNIKAKGELQALASPS